MQASPSLCAPPFGGSGGCGLGRHPIRPDSTEVCLCCSVLRPRPVPPPLRPAPSGAARGGVEAPFSAPRCSSALPFPASPARGGAAPPRVAFGDAPAGPRGSSRPFVPPLVRCPRAPGRTGGSGEPCALGCPVRRDDDVLRAPAGGVRQRQPGPFPHRRPRPRQRSNRRGRRLTGLRRRADVRRRLDPRRDGGRLRRPEHRRRGRPRPAPAADPGRQFVLRPRHTRRAGGLRDQRRRRRSQRAGHRRLNGRGRRTSSTRTTATPSCRFRRSPPTAGRPTW